MLCVCCGVYVCAHVVYIYVKYMCVCGMCMVHMYGESGVCYMYGVVYVCAHLVCVHV